MDNSTVHRLTIRVDLINKHGREIAISPGIVWLFVLYEDGILVVLDQNTGDIRQEPDVQLPADGARLCFVGYKLVRGKRQPWPEQVQAWNQNDKEFRASVKAERATLTLRQRWAEAGFWEHAAASVGLFALSVLLVLVMIGGGVLWWLVPALAAGIGCGYELACACSRAAGRR